MSFDLPAMQAAVAAHGRVARVLITRTAGSAPRGAGTVMLVWDGGQSGTIGGGTLELEAARAARGMVAGAVQRTTYPLGPRLGQCCGGSVTVVTECFDAGHLPDSLPYARSMTGGGVVPLTVQRKLAGLPGCFDPVEVDGWLIESELQQARPLWIYGAGHVGRALVSVLAPLPDFAITWVDTAADRFDVVPDGVTPLVAADPARVVPLAPANAEHLILTYSHEMDLALCHAVLRREFHSAGVIGSATKWARFRSRLAALGHGPAQISRMACPIGDPALGKHPQAIALGVATTLLKPAARHSERDFG